MASRRLQAVEPNEPFLTAAYVLHVLALTRRWGITSDELLAEFGLDEQQLEVPDAMLSISTICEVLRRARLLTGEPGIGILFGLNTRASTYGYLTFATMCAATLGECIELAIQFVSTISTAYNLRLNRAGGISALVADELCDVGDVRDILLLGLLIGMRQIGCVLTGREPWRPIDVAIPEPDYYRRFAHLVPELRFDQPINQIVLLESDLELPLLTPDRAALRLAVEQCEHRMQALGLGTRIEQRVLRLLLQHHGSPSFDEIAARLSVAPRTLKRRLAGAGISFSELAEQARRERALLLLHSGSLSLDDVAERLGYSTVSNLVRAFRRWTGMTPSAYRRGVSSKLNVHLPLRR
jgi:AraC-like DNA-binding protein